MKIISEPAYVERQARGSEITATPEEMRRIQMKDEIELYRDMMKIAGIEPEIRAPQRRIPPRTRAPDR